MKRQAYLVAHVNTDLTPPALIGTRIYSSAARSITGSIGPGRYAFDVIDADGDTYDEAKKNLKTYCERYPTVFGWALEMLNDD